MMITYPWHHPLERTPRNAREPWIGLKRPLRLLCSLRQICHRTQSGEVSLKPPCCQRTQSNSFHPFLHPFPCVPSTLISLSEETQTSVVRRIRPLFCETRQYKLILYLLLYVIKCLFIHSYPIGYSRSPTLRL